MKINNSNLQIIALKNRVDFKEKAAYWFHKKWNIPEEIYLESIIKCQKNPIGIPQWYLVIDSKEAIIAGLGLIENDFHKRKDLSPNICALYVEKKYRNRGIAKDLLDFACEDACVMGYQKIYLITKHEAFYEKCGWHFIGMVEEENGHQIRMYKNDGYIL